MALQAQGRGARSVPAPEEGRDLRPWGLVENVTEVMAALKGGYLSGRCLCDTTSRNSN